MSVYLTKEDVNSFLEFYNGVMLAAAVAKGNVTSMPPDIANVSSLLEREIDGFPAELQLKLCDAVRESALSTNSAHS